MVCGNNQSPCKRAMETSAVLRPPLSPVSQAGGQVVYPHLELWCLKNEWSSSSENITHTGANNNNRNSTGVGGIRQAKLSVGVGGIGRTKLFMSKPLGKLSSGSVETDQALCSSRVEPVTLSSGVHGIGQTFCGSRWVWSVFLWFHAG